MSKTLLTVRYAETDRMGIVHHSNYPIWFEAGRTDFIRELGLPYSKIEERGFMLPLLSMNCTFKEAAKYEDEIIIKTKIKEYTFTRVVFYYEVLKQDTDKSIAFGETMHVWTDGKLKPVNLKKRAPDIFSLISSAVGQ